MPSLFLFFEVWVVYNIILVSSAQHSESKFYRLYSIYSYYEVLAIFPVVQCIFIYFINSSLYLLIPYPDITFYKSLYFLYLQLAGVC